MEGNEHGRSDAAFLLRGSLGLITARTKQDPHRTAYAEETLVRPTLPFYEAFNPAMADVNVEDIFSIAMIDVINNGMAAEAVIDKAFKRAEAIFAKYPIAQA